MLLNQSGNQKGNQRGNQIGTGISFQIRRRQGRKNAKVLIRHPFTIGRWKEHKAYKGHKEA
eukprot:11601463-Ditylum_brightwellii.AAC.1